MTINKDIIFYIPSQSSDLEIKQHQYFVIKNLNLSYKKLATHNPAHVLVIKKESQLSLQEIQQLQQLKIQFPFLKLYFLSNQKQTFKHSLQLLDLEITVVKSLDKITPLAFLYKQDSKQNKLVLRKKENELLSFFHLNQGKTVSKDLLLSAVWGYNDLVFSRTLECHISSLRAKLKNSNLHIKTIHGKGYELC